MTAADYELVGVNAAQIAFAFGWGFGAIVLCWFFGFVIGAAVDLIRKA